MSYPLQPFDPFSSNDPTITQNLRKPDQEPSQTSLKGSSLNALFGLAACVGIYGVVEWGHYASIQEQYAPTAKNELVKTALREALAQGEASWSDVTTRASGTVHVVQLPEKRDCIDLKIITRFPYRPILANVFSRNNSQQYDYITGSRTDHRRFCYVKGSWHKAAL